MPKFTNMKLKQLFIILFLTCIIPTTINATDLLPNAHTTSHSDSSGIKKNKKIKWFIQAGILDANAKESYILTTYVNGSSSTSKFIFPLKSYFGYKAGLSIKIPVYKRFSFSPELNFIQKGDRFNYNTNSGNGYSSAGYYRMNFIELPLNIIYDCTKGILVGLGINLSYGIGGKDHNSEVLYDSTGNNIIFSKTINDDIKFDGKYSFSSDGIIHLKAFEASGNVIVGYQISPRYIIKAEYNLGFTNLYVNGGGPYNDTFKTSYFALNFCYGL